MEQCPMAAAQAVPTGEGGRRAAEGDPGWVHLGDGSSGPSLLPMTWFFHGLFAAPFFPFRSQGSVHRVQMFHSLSIIPQVKQRSWFFTFPLCAGCLIGPVPTISYLPVSLFWQDDNASS